VFGALVWLAPSLACIPNLGQGAAPITAPRVLAIRADPAEARPGTMVTFTALVAISSAETPPPVGREASADETVGREAAANETVAWSFCRTPRPLTTDGVVASDCVAPPDTGVATGTAISLATPSDGCSVFGPDAPARLRPADPDATGGYYQPIVAFLPGAPPAVMLARITCDLPNATAAVAAQFTQSYVPNANPSIASLAADVAGVTADLGSIHPNARVHLQVAWPPASAETYAYYDAALDSIVWQREAMSVAWYASAGAIDRESTVRAADDPETTSDDDWTAPAAPGPFRLWVVLRDSRGGVDFRIADGAVAP
jgi:hypothetical protein